MALDEKPVEEPVDEVGGDEHKHDGPHMTDGLEIAAKGPIKQQGQSAEAERSYKWAG